MLTFIEYLNEEFLVEAGEGSSSNDDNGKRNELELCKNAHPNGNLPDHFRARSDDPVHSGTPKQVFDKLSKKMDPAKKKAIAIHAKETFDQVKKKIRLPKGHEITGAYWTSNRDTEKTKGDHEKLTGIKDVHSNADLIVISKHPTTGATAHHPISAKYGSHPPAYKNAGLGALEQHAAHAPGTYSNIVKEHHSAMDKLGYTGSKDTKHAQYKLDAVELMAQQKAHEASGSKKEFKPKGKLAKRAHTAEQSSIAARTKIARLHETGLHGTEPNTPAGNKKRHDRLSSLIRSQVSPPTHLPHLIAHSKTNANGKRESHVEYADTVADNHLNQFEHGSFHVKPGNGITATIYGKHKLTGKIQPAASQVFKTSSGPLRGMVGSFKLPAKSKD